MTTKFFGFRLSGDLLDKAAEKVGYDQISSKAKQLFIDYLLSDSNAITDSTRQNTDTSKKKQSDRLDQIDSVISDILNRLDQLDQQLSLGDIDQSAAIATNTDILPEVIDMNNKPRQTPRKQLLELLGIGAKSNTKYIQDTFKRVTGIDPIKSDLPYPDGMLSYLKENPDILNKKIA